MKRLCLSVTILPVLLIAGGASAARAPGPLRVHPDNPRYFSDGTRDADGKLKAVYLAGSHTWPNLIDRGPKDPPPAFDFNAYLDLLGRHDHNFIRLWSRHVSWYHDYGDDGELHATPLAWPRTGPGNALDGKPKFDLSRLDESYFRRLRARVAAARDRGVYVGVMLFGGHYECRGGWRGNPFNAANNVNQINGDPNADGEGLETQTLGLPEITRLQEAYVRKVIETVNDLDNVLYEISNESDGSSKAWQYHLVDFIHKHEATLPKRHPVGMTALYDNDNGALLRSNAEWVSPSIAARDVPDGLPVADGRKVSLLDSDHWWIFQIVGDPKFGRDWVWKGFCRGHHALLMENFPVDSGVDVPVTTDEPGHVASRKAMGAARGLAGRINLAAMVPRPELASTRYCLAAGESEYVVYLPEGGTASVDLTAARGEFDVEWIDPERGGATASPRVPGGAERKLTAPKEGAAVLRLKRTAAGAVGVPGQGGR